MVHRGLPVVYIQNAAWHGSAQVLKESRNTIGNDRASRRPKKLPSTAKTGKRGRPVKLN